MGVPKAQYDGAMDSLRNERNKVKDIKYELDQEIQRGETKDQTISKLESCISELN